MGLNCQHNNQHFCNPVTQEHHGTKEVPNHY